MVTTYQHHKNCKKHKCCFCLYWGYLMSIEWVADKCSVVNRLPLTAPMQAPCKASFQALPEVDLTSNRRIFQKAEATTEKRLLLDLPAKILWQTGSKAGPFFWNELGQLVPWGEICTHFVYSWTGFSYVGNFNTFVLLLINLKWIFLEDVLRKEVSDHSCRYNLCIVQHHSALHIEMLDEWHIPFCEQNGTESTLIFCETLIFWPWCNGAKQIMPFV